MSKIKSSLLILLAMLILLAIPMAFASDVGADEMGIGDDSSDVIQYGDDSVLSDSENGFYIHDAPIEINEGENATLIGEILLDGNNVYDDLNFKYSYVDSNGITQSKNLEYRPIDDDIEFKIIISDLTAANSPYIVTFSVIDDDLYEDFQIYGDILDETVTINVIGTNTPIEDPAIPEYATITPAGQLYVDDSEGNDDENDGSESTPYKTIQKAIDQNKALGGNYEIIVNAGTYNVSGKTIDSNVRITGRGKVIIDANQADYHFSVSANTAEFNNLTLINGKGTTGSISGSSSSSNANKVLNVINCTFKDNNGYIGVLRTYATTTILSSNFINNVATVGSTGFGNIIYSAENSLTVNFCNFVNNTPKTGKTTVDSVEKSNANYNFWGTNDGPSTTDLGEKVTARAWVILNATLDSTTIKAGNDYTLTIKNQYVKGEETGDLAIPMAILDVDVAAEDGTVTPETVTVSNNLGETTYTAPNAVDDAITIKTYGNTLKTINVEDIVVPEYVSTPTVDGSSSVEFTKGSTGVMVYVNITSDKLDGFYDPYGGGWSVDVYIDGVAAGLELKDASEGSFTFDLAVLDDEFVAGNTYNIIFRPAKSAFGDYGAPEFDNSIFNNLTVTVKAKPVTPVSYDYETTPNETYVNYVFGQSKEITVAVVSDYLSDLSSENVYAWINGEGTNNRYLINGVKGSDSSFKFDLSKISDKLSEGENTVTFHVTSDENSKLYLETWGGKFNFNALTINASKTSVTPTYLYVVTPNVASVEYKKGESCNVSFTFEYGDLDLDYVDIAVFIDGSNWKSGVVDADSYDKVVTIDLADYDDDLDVGTHTVVVRHTNDMYDSNWDELGPSDCQFNALSVNVVSDEPVVPDYVSTPTVNGSSSVEFIKGSTGVTVYVNITSDKLDGFYDPWGDTWFVDAYVDGVAANLELKDASEGSFTFDLAVLDDEFEVGNTYNIIFRPAKSAFEPYYGAPDFDKSVFNNLTVTVKESGETPASYDYVVNFTDPVSATIDYAKGNESVKISVVTNYDYKSMKALDDSKMYAFINGNATGIIVKNSFNGWDVRGSALTFAFNLTQFDEYLTKSVNTIVFHPDESYYANANITTYYYQPLTVNIVGDVTPEVKYTSTPTVNGNNTVEYLIDNHTSIVLTVDCDLMDEFESYDKLYAWIGNDYQAINVMANEKTANIDLKDLSDKFWFEEGQTYTVYFHPDIDTLKEIGIKEGEYVFNPLTVKVVGTYTPEPTVVYTSTPNETSIDYTIGNDTNVTVNVVYDESYGSNAGFAGKNMRIFINGDTTGVVISDVKANATSFTINLADYITEEGDYSISFGPGDSVLSWVFYGVDNYVVELNNLTVKATKASEPVPEYLYVSGPNVANVTYTKGESCNVTFTIVYDGLDLDYVDIAVFIDGSNWKSGVVDVDSYDKVVTIDLADYDDDLSVGNHTIVVRHTNDMYDSNWDELGPSDCQFNALNVTVVEAPKPVEVVNYTATPQTSSVDYTIGNNKVITINIDYNSTYADVLGELPVYVFINDGEGLEIVGVKANVTTFEMDLKAIADYLTIGKNVISFGPKQANLTALISDVNATYNALTVNAENAPTNPNNTYVSTPTPDKVYYTLNESSNVTVSVTYDLFFNNRLAGISVFVYINGEEISDRVKIDGVYANDTVFTFDLKEISDKLVEGQNNLTFHPHPGALEGTFVGPYVYNRLTVIVGSDPEPVDPTVIYKGIIYVDANGNDTNDGSETSPVATIAKAIELASSDNNTEHKIIIREGTYAEHDLNITSALDIAGEGNVIIDAQQLGRILDINTADAVNVAGITFINGKADKGGAIKIKDAKVTIDDAVFENNTASGWGSAIMWDANDGKLTNSVFDDNTCRNAAVVIGEYSWTTRKTSGENTVIDNCLFNNNHNVELGNCMGLDISGSNVTVKNTNFTNNKGESRSEHGALYIKGDDVTVDNCLFENNSMGMAAAIQIDGENALIQNSKFVNNTVTQGLSTRSGAIEVQNAATIKGNTFVANGGDDCVQGGAIDIVYADYGGDIVIADNNFINNTASSGAAIFVDGGSEDGCEFDSLTIENNTFEGNAADYGAGIYTATSSTPIDIKNNKFTKNSAKQGSAVFADLTTVNLEANTMVDNDGDGDIYSADGEISSKLTLTFTAPSEASVGKAVKVTATLLDDMNNTVSGIEVKFISNGKEIGAKNLVGGSATVDFTPDEAKEYTISGSIVDDATVVSTKINAIVNATIEIPEVSGISGEKVTVPVSVKLNGENVDNESVSVTFDNKTFDVAVVNGTANVVVDLPNKAGNYDLTVSYKDKSQTQSVTVDAKTITIIEITTSTGNNFTGVLRDIAGNPISDAEINYSINGVNATVKTKANGSFDIETQYGVKTTLSYAGNTTYEAFDTSITINDVTPVRTGTTILGNNFTQYAIEYDSGERGQNFTVQLKDSNGNVLANKTVLIGYNGKTLERTTDANGYANVQINLRDANRLTFAVAFLGDENYNATMSVYLITITKKPVTITASAKSYKASTKTKKYTVTLKTIKGASADGKTYFAAGKKVTMKIDGKTYTAKTNAKGQATFSLKITKKGKFAATIKYAGDNTYASASKAVKYITIK